MNAIRHLAQRMAAVSPVTDIPTTLKVGKDLYPLSRTMRDHFVSAFEIAGGTVNKKTPTKLYVDRWDQLARAVAERQANDPTLEIKTERVLQEDR